MALNKTVLTANIEADIANNTTGDISASDVRNNVLDLVDSVFDIPGESTRNYSQTVTQGSSILGAVSIDGTLNVSAGTATRAPIKLNIGTSLTTPVVGAIEFDGNSLYITNTGLSRQAMAIADETAPLNRQINTTAPLSGGGDLTADRTLSIPPADANTDGYLTAADWNTFFAGGSGNVPPTRAIFTDSPLSGSGNLTADITLSISQADSTTDGYLASGDWTTFNDKVPSTRTVTPSAPLTGGGNLSGNIVIGIPSGSASVDGYIASGDWNTFNNKAPINSPTFTGTVGGITASMVGLGSVDNTSDANKPVSTATQTALNLKANIASPTFTGTVAGITSTMVGLGNVDNTSDANKPVSTATQTALNLKANLASPTFTGTVGGITASMVGLGSVNNTSDADKPVSTAQQTALNLKANIASPTFTGTVSGITSTMVGLGNVDNTSDANKPVSTATQTALNLKADSSHTHGNVTNAGAIGATANLPIITTTAGVLTTGVFGTSANQFAEGNHNHSGTYQPLDTQLTSLAGLSYTGNTLKVVRVNAGETDFELATISVGGGDALVANTLDQFADVTQTAGQTLAITSSTTLSGGTHSGTNTGDQTNISGNAATVTTNANLTGDVTSVGNATTLTNAPVIAKVLTGYTAGAGTVAATDSILQGIQKLDGNIALKANIASPTFTGTVSGITSTMVGLGNVDNTSDANKPVSTATQTALNLKANLASPTFTGTPTLPTGAIAVTQTPGDNTTAIATTAFVAALGALKQPLDTQLTSLAGLSYAGNTLKAIRVNAAETDFELFTIAGGGDAFVGNSLDQFADVTQTAGKTLSITDNTVLNGGTHSGTNTGDQTNITGNAATVTTNANLTGDVTSVGNATTLTNAPVIAKVLTGYTAGAGTVAATDSILQGIQKLDGNIALKANIASPTFTGTVAGITSTMVGLGNVDNTSDANKPVSTATQTALNLKANLASPTFTGTPTLPTGTIAVTQTPGDNTTAVATTAFVAALGALMQPLDTQLTDLAALVYTANALKVVRVNAAANGFELATAATGDALVANSLDQFADVTQTAGQTLAITSSTTLSGGTHSGTNTGDQTTISGNAGSATILATARTISGTGEATFTTTAFDGSAAVSGAVTLTNSAVIGKLLTGYTVGAGTVAATDTILQGFQKLDGNIALKANIASPTFTGTVSGITSTMVGLGNVDNTSDANKPVSTATQTALNLKANLASPTFTGTPTLPTGTIATTQTPGDNTTAVATTAFVAALGALKQPLDTQLTSLAGLSYTGNSLKIIRVNAGETDFELVTAGGGGDALVANSLDQFADVTQTAGQTLAITSSTTLSGGTHSGTNTGDQTTISGNAGSATILATARTISGTGEATFTTTAFDGSAAVSGAVTLTNSAVIGKLLTGYTVGAGTVAATDTILQAFQKLDGNVALKANIASPTFTGTVSGITSTMVGLGNVDNTSDANKPVSTAQQTALNLKANLASPTFTGTPTLPTGTIAVTQTAGDNTTAVATTAFVTTANATNANLTGDVTSVGNATTLTNAPVIAKVLTGFTSGAGTVSAADSILSAFQKLDGNIGGKQPLDTQLTSLATLAYAGNSLKVVRVNAGETDFELATISAGAGDALVANSLDQFADVTQTAGQTLAITSSTTLNGGTHSGTNTGDQTNISGNAATVTTNANLTGDVTSVGNATTLTNAPVIAKVLTGYTVGAGTVAATDSILQGIQKLDGNIALKANIASPTFTGTATFPNGTQIGTASGTIGIGTSAQTYVGLWVANNDIWCTGSNVRFLFGQNTTDYASFHWDTASSSFGITGEGNLGFAGASIILPYVNGSISKVGINQPIPECQFHVRTTADGITILQNDDGGAVGSILRLRHKSASPTTSDVPGNLQFTGRSTTGADVIYGSFKSTITDATNASEDATLTLSTMVGGALTDAIVISTSSATLYGSAIATAADLSGYQPLDTQLTSLAGLSYTGNTLKFVRVNAGETGFELVTLAGGGDALVANSLDQFADVTQTAGQTLAITSSTTLSGGTHSGTNTGDEVATSVSVAFTDGDTFRRVTIADAAVSNTSKIIYGIRRANIAADVDDPGWMYNANIIYQGAGTFDVIFSALEYGLAEAATGPNETITFNYTVL